MDYLIRTIRNLKDRGYSEPMIALILDVSEETVRYFVRRE